MQFLAIKRFTETSSQN